MAGMLAGVECARRRRLHQSKVWCDSTSAVGHVYTRRSSFCLYTSNNDIHHKGLSFLNRGLWKNAYQDEKLGEAAREAKERLDERLRSQRIPDIKRSNSKEKFGPGDRRSMLPGELQKQVFGSKKKSIWSKLSWKAAEQGECAICLEKYKAGETLLHLPCAHRYHVKCLAPWLENNAHCPCCRMGIVITQ